MKSFLRPQALGLGLLMLLLLPACGVRQLAQGEIQPPSVSFQGLTLGQPTSRGWPLSVALLLTNPNPRPLNLLGYDYHLWIEGKSVATGVSRQAVFLPPRGQTLAEVPILVQPPAVIELLPRVLPRQQPKLHYQIAGSFRLASVLGGIIPIPFHFQGEASPREGLDFLKPYLH
jgi:LEA14-like dessication related protein